MRHPPFQSASARDLAIARMNDGHVLLLAGDPASLAAALTAYDDAIALLRPLTAANSPSTCNSLAAALMNRGEIVRRLHGPARFADAATAFTEAAALLRPLPLAGHPAWRRNLVGTLLNHATLLLATQPASPAAAELVEEALALVRVSHRPGQGQDPGSLSDPALAPLAAQLVHLGALFYAAHQPYFFAEFIREHLSLAPADPGLIVNLRTSLDLARRRLLDRWLVSENSLPATRLLATLADLRTLRADFGEPALPVAKGALSSSPALALDSPFSAIA
jgi:hypothetical protein